MAKVVVELLGKTAGLNAGLAGVARSVLRVTAVMTAAGGAMAALTKRAINQADEMGKAAQRIGLAVDQYSRLAAAAEFAGVPLKSLERAAKDMGLRMQRAGEQARPLMDVLMEHADAFERMPDGIDKTNRAIELFGENGQKLLPLLNQGSAAIREQMEEYERFGGVVGPEFAKNAARFNDNLRRLRNMFEGLWRQLARNILPSLNQFIEAGIRFVTESGAWEGTLLTLIDLYKIFAETIVRVGSGLLATIDFVSTFTAALDKGDSVLMAATKSAIGYEQALKKMEERIQSIRAIGTAVIQIEGTQDSDPVADEIALANDLNRIRDQLAAHDKRRTEEMIAMRERAAASISGIFQNSARAAEAFGEKGFVAYKALASAAALVDTYRAATAAYAAVVGVPYVGPFLAPIAAGAAVAAGLANIAMINAASFMTGGVIPGGEQMIRVNEQGTEGVVNARGMRNLGAEGLAAINAGLLNAASLATTIPAGLAGGIPAGGGGAGNPSPAGGGSSTIHVLLVDSRNSQAARQFLESSAGRAIVRDVVTDQRQEIGVPT